MRQSENERMREKKCFQKEERETERKMKKGRKNIKERSGKGVDE